MFSTNLKALAVILLMATLMFHLLKPYALQYIRQEDYARRRNVWLLITSLAFTSNNFWVYAIGAFTIMFIAGTRDKNPIALYVILFQVVPDVGLDIPAAIVNRLFTLTNYRLLSLAVLLPALMRSLSGRKKSVSGGKGVNYSILLYLLLLLQLGLEIPYEDFTNTVRRATLFMLDYYLLVRTATVSCDNLEKLKEVFVSYCLVCAVMVPVAAFEAAKGWLLYDGVASAWGAPIQFAYLMRGDLLRAQASAGHSLSLGLLLTVGFGFWLLMADSAYSRRTVNAGFMALWAGLLASFARASWIATAICYVGFRLPQKGGVSRLIKVFAALVPFVGIGLITPYGEKIAAAMPFIGTVDASNVEYRERLGARAWELISNHPFFGDALFLTHLEDLRQGQGIIDLVNVYATFAMEFGLVGLAIFLMPYILSIKLTWQYAVKLRKIDPSLASVGHGLFAVIIADAFFMYTASFVSVVPIIYYLLIGLSAVYAQLARKAIADHSTFRLLPSVN